MAEVTCGRHQPLAANFSHIGIQDPAGADFTKEIILVEGQLGQATIRHDDDQETISNFPPQPLRNVAVCDLRLEVFAEGWIGLRASTSFFFFDMRPKHGRSGPRTIGTLKSCQPTHAGSSDI